ncbi:hypothetical protein DFS34DRAFT_679433 [Phlyctochytrium arcticum]|nr:hypothetical protein DFS34DRAFT_679433 [Phlyctochytrium arcticum]
MDFSDLNDRLLFAIPKKGRLHEHCLTLLKGADIQFHRRNRLDIALSTNHPIALVFLPAADIGTFVAEGNVDIGITGQDVIAEAGADVEELLELEFGKCRLCVQTPVSGSLKTSKDLVGKRIVTSFSSLVQRYFAALENGATEEEASAQMLKNSPSTAKSSTSVKYINGSVEAACALGLADGIVDLVESGETMREAKLHAITTLMTSQAVLVCNPEKHRAGNPVIDTVKRRIQGVIAAQRYVLVTYNVEKVKLPAATKITPGRKAPSIIVLEKSDWVAVSVMVLKHQCADIMDQLEVVGAQDILVTTITNCRLS